MFTDETISNRKLELRVIDLETRIAQLEQHFDCADEDYHDPEIDNPGYEPVDDTIERERIARHND